MSDYPVAGESGIRPPQSGSLNATGDLGAAQRCVVVALRDLEHGDWKTTLARPDRYPAIKKGTECKFVKRWTNLYGAWVTILGPNGNEYDVREGDLWFGGRNGE